MSDDPALMMRATLAVLDVERHDAPASLRTLIDRGRKRWCEWYGEQSVSRLRTDWPAGRRGRAQLSAAATLRHSPSVVVRHVRRKAARILFSVWHRAAAASRHRLTPRRRRVMP
jgi:hypothetical protein